MKIIEFLLYLININLYIFIIEIFYNLYIKSI
jgi:hypothetical protein